MMCSTKVMVVASLLLCSFAVSFADRTSQDNAFQHKLEEIKSALEQGSAHQSHATNRKLAESQDNLVAASRSLIEKLQSIDDVDLTDLKIPRRLVESAGTYGGYGAQDPNDKPPVIGTTPTPSPSPTQSPAPVVQAAPVFTGATKVPAIPVTVKFQMDYAALVADDNKLNQFKEDVRVEMARSLGLDNAAYIKIIAVRQGSVVVDTQVLVPDTVASDKLLSIVNKVVSQPATLFGTQFQSQYQISGVSGSTTLDTSTIPGYNTQAGSAGAMVSVSFTTLLSVCGAFLLSALLF